MQIISLTLWQLFNVDTLRNKIRGETADQCKKEFPDSRGGRCWSQNVGYWFLTAAVTNGRQRIGFLQDELTIYSFSGQWEWVSFPGYSHGEQAVFLLGPQGSTHSLAFFQLLRYLPSFPHSLCTPPTSASIFNSPSRLWCSFFPLTKAQWLGPAG